MKWKTTADFGITHISFIFLFFDSKPGSCQPICGYIIANKSFSSAKAALVCSFRASGKNRRHLGCSNVMRSRGRAVQNKGITLNTMVASLTSSCLTIGSHCNYLRIGVTWSNFLVPETIRAAKFCTVCNISMFFLVVLARTDEQYNNLLNTRELIIVINVRLSNRYFTRFIWQRLPIHYEVNWVICSSYVKLQSIVTPTFFADLDDVISLLSSVMLR